MTRVPLLKTLAGVALAALMVCALDALSGAAEGVDGGGGPPAVGGDGVQPTSAPDAAVAPPPGPESGPAGADRRRPRRYRRWGTGGDTGHVDAGASRDAPLLRVAARDGGFRMAGRDGGFRMASRDAGFRLPVVAPPVAPPPPPPPPPPTPSGPSTSLPVTELGFNTCQKVPAGKRVVKVNLKPDVELPELVAWISSITCKSFVLPGHLGSAGKKLTFITQGMLTRDEAYAAFLNALDSVGLAVERGPGYYKIIEASKAKSGALPVYGFDGKPTQTPPKRAKE